jgi:uncharacterized protein DUF3489
MSSSVSEQHPDASAGESQPPPNKPRSAALRGDTAPPKARSGRKAIRRQKSAKGPKSAAKARKGSKTFKILALLERSSGATVKELMKATGRQPHSMRGFLSGVVSKKMGLKVRSSKDESGERRYAVKS